MRILAVAYEPWETELLARVLDKACANGDEGTLVTVDLWQQVNRKAYAQLRDWQLKYDSIAWANLFEAWPQVTNSTLESRQIRNWQRSLRISQYEVDWALFCDEKINHYERSPRLKTNMTQKSQELLVCFQATFFSALLERHNPDELWMLGVQGSAKYLASRAAVRRNVTVKALQRSRISTLAIVTDYPAITESGTIEFKTLSHSGSRLRPENRSDSGTGSYVTASMRAKENLIASQQELLVDFIAQLLDLSRFILRQIKLWTEVRPEWRNVNTYMWSYRKICFHAVKRAMRRTFYLVDVRFGGLHIRDSAEVENRPYVLILAHYRPESATLVMGNMYDDEDVLLQVVATLAALGLPWDVVFLENSSMVGERPRLWYRQMSNRGITNASAVISSQELMAQCKCVIGISGTALLEAALSSKPSFAFGAPEFHRALRRCADNLLYSDSNGTARGSLVEQLQSFFRSVENENHTYIAERANEYVDQVRNVAESVILGWSPAAQQPKNVSSVYELFCSADS